MKTEPVKHLKITEGKVFSTSMDEPKLFPAELVFDMTKNPMKNITEEFNAIGNKEAMDAFNASFVEVESNKPIIHAYGHRGKQMPLKDGLYVAPEGLVMKVYPKPIKEEFEREGLAVRFPEKWEHGSTMWDWTQKVAVLSFVPSKEAEKVEDNDNPLFFKGELCDMHNRPACKPKDRVDCKCEWAAFDRLKKVEAEPTKPDFEKELNIKLNDLPFEKHVDDGQYADGVIQGWDSGARWCKDTFVTPLQEEIKKLREQLSYYADKNQNQ